MQSLMTQFYTEMMQLRNTSVSFSAESIEHLVIVANAEFNIAVTTFSAVKNILSAVNDAMKGCGGESFIKIFLAIEIELGTIPGDAVFVWRLLSKVHELISAFFDLFRDFSDENYLYAGADFENIVEMLVPAVASICKDSSDNNLKYDTSLYSPSTVDDYNMEIEFLLGILNINGCL